MSASVLALLALLTVGLLAGARDFTHGPSRRQRILVHLDRELETLCLRPDPDRRQQIRSEILKEPLLARYPLAAGMLAAGVNPGSWTHGTRRAAVIVSNDTSSPRIAALQFGSSAPPGAPHKVMVEDGSSTHALVFEAPGSAYLELPPVAAHSQRLFIVWTDKSRFSGDPTPVETGIKIQAGNRVVRRLRELRGTRDARRWREMSNELAGDDFFDRRALDDPRLQAFNLTPDSWTRGTAPAAVLAVNDGDRRLRPRLKLRGPEQLEVYPLTVSIDNGSKVRRFSFARPGSKTVRLGGVRPGQRRVFLVWTDKSWAKDDGGRHLGIHVRSRPR